MKKYLILVLLLALALAGCNQAAETPAEATIAPSPTAPPPPEAGMATTIGRIVDVDGNPMPLVIVRLAEVVRGVEGRGGAFILDITRSPGTFTDEQGYFIIPNITAAEYVIVVGDVESTGIYEIIPQPNGKARVFDMPADQVTDVGEIETTIQPPRLLPTQTPDASGVYPPPVPQPTQYPYP